MERGKYRWEIGVKGEKVKRGKGKARVQWKWKRRVTCGGRGCPSPQIQLISAPRMLLAHQDLSTHGHARHTPSQHLCLLDFHFLHFKLFITKAFQPQFFIFNHPPLLVKPIYTCGGVIQSKTCWSTAHK